MATGGQRYDEVKSICDRLECSPSANDNKDPFRGHPNVEPGGKSASAGKMRLSTPESELHYTRNGRVAGFSDKFARRARQE